MLPLPYVLPDKVGNPLVVEFGRRIFGVVLPVSLVSAGLSWRMSKNLLNYC